ncbi:MAG: hypothetical protein V7K57_27365 [Nostoc sp.]|uniref:hypothetical protein n=1 Tax=Nostoc sp. TaxID=1180 RepID=UPI002FFB1EFB
MSINIVGRGQVVDVGVTSFKDPAKSAGIQIYSSSLYQTYHVSRDKVKQICERLYNHVVDDLNGRNLGDSRFRIITFREGVNLVRDHRYDNQERTYIVITRDTLRDTRATILVRFLTYSDNLYVGVDTYVLGKFNIFAFIRKVLLTVLLPWFAITPLSFVPGLNVLLWLIYLCILFLAWWGLIQRIRQVGDLGTALRLEFSKVLDLGYFNLDDVTMFTKSNLYTIVTSIKDVFKIEKLPIESLDAFIRNINNINISAGGNINMSDSAIGVSNNVVSPNNATISNNNPN